MIYKILQQLEADNSRLTKEAILRRELDNDMLKRFFFLSLDPFVNFYQKKIPAYSTNWSESFMPLDYAFDLVEQKLSTREITGHAAIDYLTKLLSTLAPDDAKVLERVIEKDPKCGVSEATVNKTWPGLVSTYPVLLCEQFSEKLVAKLRWKDGVILQRKEDGMRCNIVIDNDGKVTVFTRKGRPIETYGVFDYIANHFKGVMLDGELLVRHKNGEFLDRKTGNGIAAKALKGTVKKEDCEMFFLNLWDTVPYSDFKAVSCKEIYSSRFTELNNIISVLKEKVGNINLGIVETQTVYSCNEAQAIFQGYLEQKAEGVILKDRYSIWEDKRSKSLIKMKAELNTSLLCTGVEPGTGKYAGMIGALICESSDGLIKVNVGTGLTDDDRKLPESAYINKIISVKYNEKILAKDNTWSLFLPVFEEIRIDQDEADNFEKVK